MPAINQFEMHPYLTHKPLLEQCKKYGITPQSWGPLGGGKIDPKEGLLGNPIIAKIGEKYGKSNAQIILRWNIDIGVVCIPKSVTPSRIKANIDVFDFALTKDEIAAIDNLNQDLHYGAHPDTFNF